MRIRAAAIFASFPTAGSETRDSARADPSGTGEASQRGEGEPLFFGPAGQGQRFLQNGHGGGRLLIRLQADHPDDALEGEDAMGDVRRGSREAEGVVPRGHRGPGGDRPDGGVSDSGFGIAQSLPDERQRGIVADLPQDGDQGGFFIRRFRLRRKLG